jgi:hypothetical protein
VDVDARVTEAITVGNERIVKPSEGVGSTGVLDGVA